jgi:hypothetical protein
MVISKNDSIELNWGSPSSNGGRNITGYSIYKGIQSSDPTLLRSNWTSPFYEDIDVESGRSYYYQVAASNPLGSGPLSHSVMTTPGSGPELPSAPRELEAVPLNGAASLKWAPPLSSGNLNITGYIITRERVSGGNISEISFNFSSIQHTDTGLSNGEEYLYSIRSVNEIGESGASDAIKVVPERPDPPSAPINFSIGETEGEIRLAWGPPEDDGGSPIIGYSIQRWSDLRASEDTFITGSTTEFTDTGLTFGDRYSYSISAVNSGHTGEISDILSVNVTREGGTNGNGSEQTDDFGMTSSIIYLATFIAGVLLVIILMLISTRGSKEEGDEM